jgi:hypothetical protein
MFGFIATIFSVAWIQQHKTLALCILAGIIILIFVLVHRHKKRKRAYFALPVQFIGNKATKTFHAIDCPQLAKVAPANRIAFRLPAETARLGYRPCGSCSPRWSSNS